jgi:hypothetical protein
VTERRPLCVSQQVIGSTTVLARPGALIVGFAMSGIFEAARRALEAPPAAALGHIDGDMPAAAPAGVADADVGDGSDAEEAALEPVLPWLALVQGMGEARAEELEHLEAEERDLVRRKNAVRRDIKKKKQRDQRLMSKAANNLSNDQLMHVVALRAAANAKAKAKAACKAAGKAVGKAKAKAKGKGAA